MSFILNNLKKTCKKHLIESIFLLQAFCWSPVFGFYFSLAGGFFIFELALIIFIITTVLTIFKFYLEKYELIFKFSQQNFPTFSFIITGLFICILLISWIISKIFHTSFRKVFFYMITILIILIFLPIFIFLLILIFVKFLAFLIFISLSSINGKGKYEDDSWSGGGNGGGNGG